MTAKMEPLLPEPTDDVRPILDFPAETNPPLRDRPPHPVPEGVSDRREVEVGDDRTLLSPKAAQRLLDVVAVAPAVKRLLGRRYVTIGARRSATKEGRQETLALFYSYANQWTVEARLDGRDGEVSAEVVRLQPALTEEEAALAVGLARNAIGVEADGLEVGALAITREEPEDPLTGRRLADVRLFPADERSARYFAVVDLADASVIDAGRV